MVRSVLIYDGDKAYLEALRKRLEEYSDSFQLLTAPTEQEALAELEKQPISVVVVDVDLESGTGVSFVEHLVQFYPEAPFMITSKNESPELSSLAQKTGAYGLFQKPFKLKELVRKIGAAIKKEGEAGTLRGVSPGMFLQMIEMEERSCVIRMEDDISDSMGLLFFRNGELLDARINELKGPEAAYVIFSWDEVSLFIQNGCPPKESKIFMNAQAVLLEAMRRKDEGGKEEKPADEDEDLGGDSLGGFDPGELGEGDLEAGAVASLGGYESELGNEDLVGPASSEAGVEPEEIEVARVTPDSLREKLEKNLGPRAGLLDISVDNAYGAHIKAFENTAALFDAGNLVIAYLNRENTDDLVLIPGENIIALEMAPRCPKNRIIQVLTS